MHILKTVMVLLTYIALKYITCIYNKNCIIDIVYACILYQVQILKSTSGVSQRNYLRERNFMFLKLAISITKLWQY